MYLQYKPAILEYRLLNFSVSADYKFDVGIFVESGARDTRHGKRIGNLPVR